MVTGELGADMLDGTYWPEGSGSFKEVYADREAGKIAYRPTRGDDARERLENVLAWDQNLSALDEHDVPVPFDDWEVVVGPVDGEPSALLVAEYDPSVTDARYIPRSERRRYEDDFDAYAEAIGELMEDGDYIAALEDDYEGDDRLRNLGVSDDGPVVIDFGEAGKLKGLKNWLGIRLNAAEVYRQRDRFMEEHGISDRVDAVLGEEDDDGLYDRLTGLF